MEQSQTDVHGEIADPFAGQAHPPGRQTVGSECPLLFFTTPCCCNKGEDREAGDTGSPMWSVLANWVGTLLTLPDPPPDPLVQRNDLAILTVVSGLTERLSPEVSKELRKALPAIRARLRSTA